MVFTKEQQKTIDHVSPIVIKCAIVCQEDLKATTYELYAFGTFIVHELLKNGKIMLRKDDNGRRT